MVTMFGEKIKLNFASSGHYMVPLFPEHEILTATVIEGHGEGSSLKKNAIKLHLLFGHALGNRIIQLLKDAGNNDENIFKIVNDVEECDICKIYHKNRSKLTKFLNYRAHLLELVLFL